MESTQKTCFVSFVSIICDESPCMRIIQKDNIAITAVDLGKKQLTIYKRGLFNAKIISFDDLYWGNPADKITNLETTENKRIKYVISDCEYGNEIPRGTRLTYNELFKGKDSVFFNFSKEDGLHINITNSLKKSHLQKSDITFCVWNRKEKECSGNEEEYSHYNEDKFNFVKYSTDSYNKQLQTLGNHPKTEMINPFIVDKNFCSVRDFTKLWFYLASCQLPNDIIKTIMSFYVCTIVKEDWCRNLINKLKHSPQNYRDNHLDELVAINNVLPVENLVIEKFAKNNEWINVSIIKCAVTFPHSKCQIYWDNGKVERMCNHCVGIAGDTDMKFLCAIQILPSNFWNMISGHSIRDLLGIYSKSLSDDNHLNVTLYTQELSAILLDPNSAIRFSRIKEYICSANGGDS